MTLAVPALQGRPVTSANCESAILHPASAAAVRPRLQSGSSVTTHSSPACSQERQIRGRSQSLLQTLLQILLQTLLSRTNAFRCPAGAWTLDCCNLWHNPLTLQSALGPQHTCIASDIQIATCALTPTHASNAPVHSHSDRLQAAAAPAPAAHAGLRPSAGGDSAVSARACLGGLSSGFGGRRLSSSPMLRCRSGSVSIGAHGGGTPRGASCRSPCRRPLHCAAVTPRSRRAVPCAAPTAGAGDKTVCSTGRGVGCCRNSGCASPGAITCRPSERLTGWGHASGTGALGGAVCCATRQQREEVAESQLGNVAGGDRGVEGDEAAAAVAAEAAAEVAGQAGLRAPLQSTGSGSNMGTGTKYALMSTLEEQASIDAIEELQARPLLSPPLPFFLIAWSVFEPHVGIRNLRWPAVH